MPGKPISHTNFRKYRSREAQEDASRECWRWHWFRWQTSCFVQPNVSQAADGCRAMKLFEITKGDNQANETLFRLACAPFEGLSNESESMPACDFLFLFLRIESLASSYSIVNPVFTFMSATRIVPILFSSALASPPPPCALLPEFPPSGETSSFCSRSGPTSNWESTLLLQAKNQSHETNLKNARAFLLPQMPWE